MVVFSLPQDAKARDQKTYPGRVDAAGGLAHHVHAALDGGRRRYVGTARESADLRKNDRGAEEGLWSRPAIRRALWSVGGVRSAWRSRRIVLVQSWGYHACMVAVSEYADDGVDRIIDRHRGVVPARGPCRQISQPFP